MRNVIRNQGTRFYCYSVLLTLLILASVHVRTWQPGIDRSYDAPYHVTMADLLRQVALRRTFPATQLSIWKEHFYDKELGFHVLLASVRRWGGLLGYSGVHPPFLLEIAVLVALWLAVYCWTLQRLRVRRAYLFIPVVVFFCPLFAMRLNLLRPHVLSIMLMLVTAATLGKWPERQRPCILAGLGFLFSYSYSNPHLMLLPAMLYGAMRYPAEKARAFTPLAFAGGGILAGLVLHPQFPATLSLWKIQCIDVVWQNLTGAVVEIRTPDELGHAYPFVIAENIMLFVCPVTIAAVMWRRGQWRAEPFRLRFFLLLTGCACLGFLLNKRMIEYAVPFAAIAAALAYSTWLGNRRPRFHHRVFAGIAMISILLLPLQLLRFQHTQVPYPRQFAEWARARFAPGTYIANLFWEDFPRLFFCAPEFRYSYALDPMFAYAHDPERYTRIDAILLGRDPFPAASELKQLLGTPLVFVSAGRAVVARRMAARQYALAYQGLDGWCFNLDAPPVDHRLYRLDPAAPAP